MVDKAIAYPPHNFYHFNWCITMSHLGGQQRCPPYAKSLLGTSKYLSFLLIPKFNYVDQNF